MSLLSVRDVSEIIVGAVGELLCASTPLHIPAGSRYSGDMKQLELDEFSNWWLKEADVAFIQLVRGSSLQI